ncbi:hypothetical protein BJ742DRAFT_815400 [Cladochytrium replicatum]|nr:hypothetical protein BJ742DRAFT_815400 [Cladochytrium replicatum]
MSDPVAYIRKEMVIQASGLFGLLTVAISFWENFEKIRNKHLLISIFLFMGLCVSFLAFTIIGEQLFITGDPITSKFLYVIASASWVFAWASLTYHSATRAFLVLFPYIRTPVWLLSGAIVFAQLTLTGTGAFFFSIQSADPSNYTNSVVLEKITLTESIWYSLVESILFAATQYKIIATVMSVTEASASTSEVMDGSSQSTISLKSLVIYAKGVFRSLFYSFNIVMMFLSVGGYFTNFIACRSFTWNGMSIVLLILMTDAIRLKNTLEILHRDENRPSSNPKSGVSFGATSSNGGKRWQLRLPHPASRSTEATETTPTLKFPDDQSP